MEEQSNDTITTPTTGDATLDPSLVWTYGLLLVTGINLCSLFGIALNPLSKRPWYRDVLLFMVSIAVGVLAGSSLLFLLSAALGIADLEWHTRRQYIGRVSILLGAVFLFFNFEQLLKLILAFVVSKRKQKDEDSSETSENRSIKGDGVETTGLEVVTRGNSFRRRASTRLHALPNAADIQLSNLPVSSVNHHHQHTHVIQTASESLGIQPPSLSQCLAGETKLDDVDRIDTYIVPVQTGSNPEAQQQQQHRDEKKSCFSGLMGTVGHVQPVAWMVIFGDGIHNFVDGLSIGAGIAHSLPDGLSIALAVLAEELPHELGDFAILLRAGLTVRQALLLNFLSACLCYAGFAIGVLVGESEAANAIIFSFAAGLFLYISLTDLLPELSPDSVDPDGSANNGHGHSHTAPDATENSENAQKGKSPSTKVRLKRLGIADFGMLFGYSMMVLLAIYSEDIIVSAK